MTIINLRKQTGFRRELYQHAVVDAFIKLDPRRMVRNPVMFVVEVGSVLTTLLWVQALTGHGEAPTGFIGAVAIWLWFTVVFANFSEAVAEGRGKAQAEALRKTRRETQAKKLRQPSHEASYETVPSTSLRKDDVFLVEASDIIPVDGEIVEGIASVDESAVTGESAPVIRESGGDRSAVTGGTRLLSDWLVVRVTANPGEGFLDRMIGLIEGAKRQKTPNEIALNILLAAFTIIFLMVCMTLLPFSLLQRADRREGHTDHHHGAGGVAGLPDPDHDRRVALRHRHCRHGPHDPAQRDRSFRAGGRSCWRRRCASAGQDRHHHVGQPSGSRVHPGREAQPEELAETAQLSSLADETPEGRSIVVLAKEKFGYRGLGDGSVMAWPPTNASAGASFHPLHAQTRMSGVDMDGRLSIRKGAPDAMLALIKEQGSQIPP